MATLRNLYNMAYKFGYVPPPLPDETIYSVLAAQQRLLPDRQLIRKLFGGWKIHVRPDWPIGLEVLSTALPFGLQLDTERLLLEHTLAPLFLPFLEEKRKEALLQAIIMIDAGHPWRLAGSHNAGVRELRSCPSCFEEDRRQGRAYWHRIHQCRGVLTCPHHPDVILQRTEISRDRIIREKRFYDLDLIRPPNAVRHHLSIADHSRAVQISTSLTSLLSNPCLETNVDKIRIALRAKALADGYASAPNKIHGLRLVSDLSKWLGAPLSNMLGLGKNRDEREHWAYRFFTGGRASISPLKYTLLALFLGADPDELAHASSAAIIPPAVERSRHFGGVPPSYLRFKGVRARLKILWNSPALRVEEIARRLRISSLTVRRWAVRLDLEFPRPGPYPVKRPAPRAQLELFEERLKLKRSQWLVATEGIRGSVVDNPATNQLYLWLSRYDAKWLKRNWPKYRAIEKINWKQRDSLLVEKLSQAAELLLSKKRPCWLSKTRLIHETGYNGFWKRNHKNKLPKASKMLIKISEDRSAFYKRILR
jgi:hypothetical protein